MMFGTDWPALEPFMNQKSWVEWIKHIPELAKDYGLKFKQREIKNLLGRNAEKFLKLKI